MKDYKYVVVGAGFLGSTVAERIASELNEDVLVIDKRSHIGGNCYSQVDAETKIEYHNYGTHIFHTSNTEVWDYINKFTSFNSYRHQVLTTYKDKVYQMPINLETINSFYNLNLKPYQVNDFLKSEITKSNITDPTNFEEMAISLIGEPLYSAFIKGYTLKQWQRDPKELPSSIIKRLPFRKNYDENYYNSLWQGIPSNGYGAIFEKMLNHPRIKLLLNTDFFDLRDSIPESTKIIYSGAIDKLFNYKFGPLEWRSLKFVFERIDVDDLQGTSVMNYAEESVPYTRIHEWKHLHPERDIFKKDVTLITKEYSIEGDTDNPSYPVGGARNRELLKNYLFEAKKLKNHIIGGRLGEYKYYDMHQTLARGLEIFNTIRDE
jgi:UDP-galactopyranose mutase